MNFHSAMEYGVLGEDILEEILLRLPKKALYRFKCVSKGWKSLISDRTRISPKTTDAGLICQCVPPLPRSLFTLRNVGKPFPMAFLCAHSDGSASNFPSLCFPLHRYLSVCDSCNGLLLLQKAFFDFVLPSLPMGYVVYNPATKTSVAIPLQSSERDLLRVGFAFDGHCYQVIRVCSGYDAGTLQFEIFSSQTGEWRVKQVAVPPQQSSISYSLPPIHSNQSVFLKESIHWLLGKFLLIFHMKDESLKLAELPGWNNSGLGIDKCIWESEGRLNYCKCDKNGICIWVLHMENRSKAQDQNGFEWQMKHSATLKIPTSEISYSSFEPCAFNDDFEIVYMQCNRRLFSYKLETGVLKEVCIDSLEVSCAENICAVYPFLYSTVDLP